MKLVILDRDGVINQESRAFVKSPAEWLPLPGSLEAIARFSQANYTVVVTTNQSGVGRGYLNIEMLHAIHEKMRYAVTQLGGKIHSIYFCPHVPDDNCACRKPKTGLFEQLAKDYNIDLIKLRPPYIGDSLRDMEAAIATGCTFFLTTGHGGDGQETLQILTSAQKDKITIVENLAAAADLLLQ